VDAARADVALLARITARDPAALGELYDRHSRLIFGLVLRMLRNRAEAEEVLQEVFVQVWTRAGSFHQALGSPVGWMVGIARNRAIDRLRAAKLRQPGPAGAPEAIEIRDAVHRADAVRNEQQLDIQRAVEALSADQRELIEEAYFLGFTHSELAERHGLPLGTVKTRIRSAMQTLRGQLAGRDFDQ
jgi:RNA polymerase sigma-70 factor (ECF subfamily)